MMQALLYINSACFSKEEQGVLSEAGSSEKNYTVSVYSTVLSYFLHFFGLSNF